MTGGRWAAGRRPPWTIVAGALRPRRRHAAVLELARALADQCDQAGKVGHSTRLTAAYLSTLKDVSRALGAIRRVPATTSTLERLRATAGQEPARQRAN